MEKLEKEVMSVQEKPAVFSCKVCGKVYKTLRLNLIDNREITPLAFDFVRCTGLCPTCFASEQRKEVALFEQKKSPSRLIA